MAVAKRHHQSNAPFCWPSHHLTRGPLLLTTAIAQGKQGPPLRRNYPQQILLKPVLQWVTALSGTSGCTQNELFVVHEPCLRSTVAMIHVSGFIVLNTFVAHKPLFWGKLCSFYIWCHIFLFGIGMWFGLCVFFKSCGVLWSASTDKVAQTTMIAIRSFFCMDGMWISDALDLVTFFKDLVCKSGPIRTVCLFFWFGVCCDVVQAHFWSQMWIWHIQSYGRCVILFVLVAKTS